VRRTVFDPTSFKDTIEAAESKEGTLETVIEANENTFDGDSTCNK
jgi:hypothetical protein